MIIYGASEVMMILGVGKSKAYGIIKELTAELEEEGFVAPKRGCIQAKFFCKRFAFTEKECESHLKQKKKEAV